MRVTALIALVATLVLLAGSACGDAAPMVGESSPTDPATGGAGLTYIALGDSLSAGFGASDPGSTSFVPLVRASLGDGYQLVNLGHGGDTSTQLIDNGYLDDATALIEDGSTNVGLVTLEIGGNDLLALYFSSVLTGVCPDVTAVLEKPECYQELQSALSTFDTNLGRAFDTLLTADPGLRLVTMTLYNPFSGSFLAAQSEIADLALEGKPGSRFEEGLNDIIRRHAAEHNIPVAELFEPFEGRSSQLISGDFIHPNNDGYAVMADAVIAAIGNSTKQ